MPWPPAASRWDAAITRPWSSSTPPSWPPAPSSRSSWPRDWPRAASLAALTLALLAMALRWWAVATLGRRWSTRIIVLPGRPLVTGGPYRVLRHPNYLAVVVELAAVPLIGGAVITATSGHARQPAPPRRPDSRRGAGARGRVGARPAGPARTFRHETGRDGARGGGGPGDPAPRAEHLALDGPPPSSGEPLAGRFDSLQLLTLVVAIEDHFQIVVTDDDAAGTSTLEEVARLVVERASPSRLPAVDPAEER